MSTYNLAQAQANGWSLAHQPVEADAGTDEYRFEKFVASPTPRTVEAHGTTLAHALSEAAAYDERAANLVGAA